MRCTTASRQALQGSPECTQARPYPVAAAPCGPGAAAALTPGLLSIALHTKSNQEGSVTAHTLSGRQYSNRKPHEDYSMAYLLAAAAEAAGGRGTLTPGLLSIALHTKSRRLSNSIHSAASPTPDLSVCNVCPRFPSLELVPECELALAARNTSLVSRLVGLECRGGDGSVMSMYLGATVRAQ